MVSEFPKLDPSVDEGGENLIPIRMPLEDWLKKRDGEVKAADDARMGWIEEQRYFLRRRLQLEFRNPTFPWVGSSDIVMPLIDMQLDKLKPSFLNIQFSEPNAVAFVAQLPASVENARNAERYFNWFLDNKCEDYFQQSAVNVDRMLQYGHSVVKVAVEHRTKNSTEVIVRNQLPKQLQAVMVQKGMTPAMADEVYNATQGQVAPLTKPEFDKKEVNTKIREVALNQFALNDDIDIDNAAADKIMDFLRNPEKYPDGKCVFRKCEVEYSAPKMWSLSPVEFIVPKGTKRLQDAPWCVHRMWPNANRVRTLARDRKWNRAAVDELLESSKRSADKSDLDVASDQNAMAIGVSLDETSDDSFEVRELYCWYDLDHDGFDEKCLITYAPATMGVLKAQELPFDHGKWPFVYFSFEQTTDKFYGPRGVARKLDDLDMEITAQHRGKLNRMSIANAPTFFYSPTQTGLNVNQIRWIPGQFYPCLDPNGVVPLQVPNLDMSFDREEEILRTWAEQHIGGTDFGLHNGATMQEPRTAQEIRAIEFNRQQVLSVRGRAFLGSCKEVWQMMWDLQMQFPQDDIYIHTTGAEPIHFTRKEIQGNFDLIPTGAIGESDPVFKATKAQNRLLLLLQVAPMISADPQWELNVGEATYQYLAADDAIAAPLIMRRRSPEEVQQIMAQQQQQKTITDQVISGAEMAPAVAAMVSDEMAKNLPRGKLQQVNQAAAAVVAKQTAMAGKEN